MVDKTPPKGAWTVVSPHDSPQYLVRLNAPSEASCWRKLMKDKGYKGRTQLETEGYRVVWQEGATCAEYHGA